MTKTHDKTFKVVCVLFSCSLLWGCNATTQKPTDSFGKVDNLTELVVADEKTGELQRILKVGQEWAERSTSDKGSDTILSLQKVASVGNYFDYYSVGNEDQFVVSLLNSNDDASKGSDIWIFGRGKTRVTNTNHVNRDPSFSQDGKFVYFVSERGKTQFSPEDQSSYVWRTPSTGGGITRIGSPAYEYKEPRHRMMKNGESMILMTTKDFYGNSEYIWYMNSNGMLPTQLKRGYDSRWLDDDSIVFAAIDDNSGLSTIWSSNLNGTELTQLVSDSEMHCLQPSPDPTGRFIAFTKEVSPALLEKLQKGSEKADYRRLSTSELRDVYLYDTRTGLSTQVTTNLSRDDLPMWSPDGRYLYIRSSRGLSWNIWRLDVAGVVD